VLFGTGGSSEVTGGFWRSVPRRLIWAMLLGPIVRVSAGFALNCDSTGRGPGFRVCGVAATRRAQRIVICAARISEIAASGYFMRLDGGWDGF
jgi:hypothetical protein